MQELKGRSTQITEGNAKGNYVSYVIEEDVSRPKISKINIVLDIYGVDIDFFWYRHCRTAIAIEHFQDEKLDILI